MHHLSVQLPAMAMEAHVQAVASAGLYQPCGSPRFHLRLDFGDLTVKSAGADSTGGIVWRATAASSIRSGCLTQPLSFQSRRPELDRYNIMYMVDPHMGWCSRGSGVGGGFLVQFACRIQTFAMGNHAIFGADDILARDAVGLFAVSCCHPRASLQTARKPRESPGTRHLAIDYGL